MSNTTTGNALVSHVPGLTAQPGDQGATNPRISADGEAVVFESDATNLLAPGADTNGTRDVFYAISPALNVVRASVDENGGEFAVHSHAGSIFHDGGGVKVAFACQDNALPPVVATVTDVAMSVVPLT